MLWLKDTYTEEDFDDAKIDIRDYITRAANEAKNLLSLFVGSISIDYDYSFDGIACVNLETKTIIINPANVESILWDGFKFVLENLDDKFSFLKTYDRYYGAWVFSFFKYDQYFISFLFLHEIGHLRYTCNNSSIDTLVKKYVSLGIPEAFIHFTHNVEEDSFIQRRFQLDYPRENIRDMFLLGTTLIQGTYAKDSYVQMLNNEAKINIRNKLFYFVLRTYNLFDKDVQSMWNLNPKIGWTSESLNLFDDAITILDSETRAKFTIERLVPKLYDTLHEITDKEFSNGTMNGDLLDQDKLREVQKTSGEEDGDSDQSSKANQSAQSGNSDDSSKSGGSDSSNDPTSGRGVGAGSNSIKEKTKQAISDACDELNKSLGNTKKSESIRKNNKFSTKQPSKKEVNNFFAGVRTAGAVTYKSLSKVDQHERAYYSFNRKAQQLYNSASQLFKRIYNFDTDDLYYLDNGELDENLITDFYTEKSINIFKQHIDLVESKKIKCVFLLDESGSMAGSRRNNCHTILPPLVHAFEDSGIKTAVYLFASTTELTKDFDDKPVLINNNFSSVLYQIKKSSVHGGTDIVPALYSLLDKDVDDETIYVLFVLTDGCFSDTERATRLFRKLRMEKNYNLFGITIDESQREIEDLALILYSDLEKGIEFTHNYSSEELITKLPYDIYNIVIDKFIKK